MRTWFLVCLMLALLLALSGPAQAQDKIEIFGGYSYLRSTVPVTLTLLCPFPTCPTSTGNSTGDLQGWEASGTYKPSSWFGLTADFGGHHGTINGADAHLHTFLVGPRVSFPGKVSPFFHVLVGGARTGGSGALVQAFVPDHTSFAAAAGVGIDIKVFSALYVRPIQVDYLYTQLNSMTQSHGRVSAGLVLHF
jgi:hypothetical protein